MQPICFHTNQRERRISVSGAFPDNTILTILPVKEATDRSIEKLVVSTEMTRLSRPILVCTYTVNVLMFFLCWSLEACDGVRTPANDPEFHVWFLENGSSGRILYYE